MPMELNRRELKAQVRERMRGIRPPFWQVTLIYLLLTDVVITMVDLSGASDLSRPGMLPMFLTFLTSLYTLVMRFGYQLWALRASRGQQPSWGTLFDGFSMAGRVVLMMLFVCLFLVGWTLLLSLPAAALMAFVYLTFSPVLSILIYFLAVLAIALWSYYRYAMAPYLLMDHPEFSPLTAVRESVNLTRGWKWEFFKLDLSFLGWYLVNQILSLGILAFFAYPVVQSILQASASEPELWIQLFQGLVLPWQAALLSVLIQIPLSLWLMPYVEISHAGFYQALAKRPVPPPPVWNGPYDGPYNGPDL